MKTNTRNLTGPALDWAVSTALNPSIEYIDSPYINPYSTDIDIADIFISSYDIRVVRTGDVWTASLECLDQKHPTVESGPTREIAVMQCFAVSRLGDTVEIPDELMF